jgi:hypothetical protein
MAVISNFARLCRNTVAEKLARISINSIRINSFPEICEKGGERIPETFFSFEATSSIYPSN